MTFMPRIQAGAVQCSQLADHPAAQGVQVAVPHHLHPVQLLLAEDGRIAVLHEGAVAAVPPIEGARVPREEAAHHRREGHPRGLEQQMRVIGHERPRVAGRGGLPEDPPEPLQEGVPVPIVPEELPALAPPDQNVLEGARGVNASLTGHI